MFMLQKRDNYKYIFIGIMLILAMLIVNGCGGGKKAAEKPPADSKQTSKAASQSPVKLNFLTLAGGTPQYALALGTSSLASEKTNLQITVQSGPGAVNIVKAVGADEAQLGSAIAATAYWGYKGGPGYDKPMPNIRVLISGSSLYHDVISTKSAGIKSIADLKGKRFTYIMPTSSYNTELGKLLLQAHGMTPDDVKPMKAEFFDAALKDLQSGRTDAVISSVGSAQVTEAGTSKELVYLPISKETIKELQKSMPFVYSYITPDNPPLPDTPGGLPVIGSPMLIIASDNLPEDVAYQFVKANMENSAELKKKVPVLSGWSTKDSVINTGIPYHPGAIKYYKEAGLWKSEAEVK